MLQDYPRVKDKLLEALQKRLRKKTVPAPFGQARHLRYCEGHRHRLLKSDGTSEEREFTEVSGTVTLKLSESDSRTMQEVVEKIDAAAGEMEKQLADLFFGHLSKATEEVGNAIDGRGRPFSAEMYLEALEKVFLDFHEDGSPHELTLVASPKLGSRVRKELSRLETDPDLVRRYAEIISRKREEWREREASRKLVG